MPPQRGKGHKGQSEQSFVSQRIIPLFYKSVVWTEITEPYNGKLRIAWRRWRSRLLLLTYSLRDRRTGHCVSMAVFLIYGHFPGVRQPSLPTMSSLKSRFSTQSNSGLLAAQTLAKHNEPPPPCGAEPRPLEVVSKPLRALETLRFSDI